MTAALADGDTLGRYSIERLLGRGAMGEVYLARDPRIDRTVAIKTLRSATVHPGELEERKGRLLREARAAGRLLHPHIVTLFDAGEEDGLLYLAFEYVPGADLAARLKEGPPPTLGEALRIARETCEGLAYAHGLGIVHRDIKPSNLMMDPAGRVKISDFGIAKLSGDAGDLTVTGSVMGSPHYLSPEQVRGDDLDGRSDLFSLGIVLFEVLSGRRPFDGETLTTLVYQILHRETPPLPPLRPGLTPALPDLLARFLAKEREARFPDAGAAARAVAALEATLPPELLAAAAIGGADDGTLRLDDEAVAAGLPPPPSAPAPGPAARGPGRPAAAGAGSPPPLEAPPAGRESVVAPAFGPGSRPLSGSYGIGPSTRRRWPLVAAVVALVILAGGGAALVATLGLPAARRLAGLAAAGRPPAPADREAAGPPPAAGREPTGISATALPPPATAERPEAPTARETPAAPADRQHPAGEPVPVPVPEAPAARASGEDASSSRPPLPAPAAGPPADAERTPPAPAGTVAEPAPAPPAATEPSLSDRASRRRSSPAVADATLETGMAVVLQVQPDDAFVLLDGTVVGQAREFGPRGGRPLELPSPGEHTLVVRRAGMRDRTVRLVAAADGPAVTPLVGRLLPLAAEETPLHALETHRVGKAIGLRVVPARAQVLVDGRPVGVAADFAGGRMGRSGWLELPLGMHRVSLVAPGHQRVDLAIDVTAGALEERKRIQVVLPPAGDGP